LNLPNNGITFYEIHDLIVTQRIKSSMAFDYKEVNDGKAVELLKRQTTLLRGAGSEGLDSERRREVCVRRRRHNKLRQSLPVRTSHMHSARMWEVRTGN
jgi:hypothetical protein